MSCWLNPVLASSFCCTCVIHLGTLLSPWCKKGRPRWSGHSHHLPANFCILNMTWIYSPGFQELVPTFLCALCHSCLFICLRKHSIGKDDMENMSIFEATGILMVFLSITPASSSHLMLSPLPHCCLYPVLIGILFFSLILGILGPTWATWKRWQ